LVSLVSALFSIAAAISAPQLAEAAPRPDARWITYEDFGAVGDGKADDLPAICEAHEYANQRGLPVRTNPSATYHLGRKALTAFIQTNTDWNTSKFITDDSKGVENQKHSLFEVRSSLKPVKLEISRLKAGQKRLDLRPKTDCLVYVENKNKRLFIRRGKNQNNGSVQSEVFVLRQDGSIDGDIDWDYDEVTRVIAQPIDEDVLHVRGGQFTHIANQANAADNSGYWARNIKIQRSKVLVEGVTQRVTGEGEFGEPYAGFLAVRRCAHVMLRNCKVDGHKTYIKIGRANQPVPMGTYGYHASHVIDFRMIKCTTGTDIMDRSRWGVVATNFMKDFLVEDCKLSRVDVHQGVSGDYIIRNSTLGHAGLNATGRGRLIIENTTLMGRNLVNFRQDYGSTWRGTVEIKDCRWIPGNRNERSPVIFGLDNDGKHDFGYPCYMPQYIKINGLVIEDDKQREGYEGVVFFNDVLDGTREGLASPYHLTKKIEVSGLKTASGKKPRISTNSKMAKAIDVEGL
jgi:hypothetical protein